ncbi:MAG: hypothetical protein GX174_09590 [Lentisphaerae bacterium]|nr:hypothetical protein [Lentisphaerota bacterium]
MVALPRLRPRCDSSSSIPGTAGTADPAGTTDPAAGKGKRLLALGSKDEQTLVPPGRTPDTAVYTPVQSPRTAHYVRKRFRLRGPGRAFFPAVCGGRCTRRGRRFYHRHAPLQTR